MAMIVGSASVTVDPDGTIHSTTSGMAGALYDGLASSFDADLPLLPTLGDTAPPYSVGRPATAQDIANSVTGRRAIANVWTKMANGMAQMVVYIHDNASAHVSTEILGRTPSPNLPSTNILAPSAPVDIPIT